MFPLRKSRNHELFKSFPSNCWILRIILICKVYHPQFFHILFLVMLINVIETALHWLLVIDHFLRIHHLNINGVLDPWSWHLRILYTHKWTRWFIISISLPSSSSFSVACLNCQIWYCCSLLLPSLCAYLSSPWWLISGSDSLHSSWTEECCPSWSWMNSEWTAAVSAVPSARSF